MGNKLISLHEILSSQKNNCEIDRTQGLHSLHLFDETCSQPSRFGKICDIPGGLCTLLCKAYLARDIEKQLDFSIKRPLERLSVALGAKICADYFRERHSASSSGPIVVSSIYQAQYLSRSTNKLGAPFWESEIFSRRRYSYNKVENPD